ncbi:MAG: Dabb family protein [Tannerella sp.]|jgi:hypothetical protein|nr:Dabb family protein [Tannerella sp.]
MRRRHFIRYAAGTTAIAVTAAGWPASCVAPASPQLKDGEIMHTVLFELKHPAGSAEAEKFLTDGRRILTAVPGVRNFQACRQCSPKNEYPYGFLMTFAGQADFEAYTAHPDHGKFVKERWETEVTRFLESDFVKI